MSSSFFEFQEKLVKAKKSAAPAPSGAKPADAMTVSQLTARITRALKEGLPPVVLVRGECSNCRPHRDSGHLYFTLKDASACIDCVMFRDDARGLKSQPQDGVELLATGRVSVYGQRGRYQLYVTRLQPLGHGALELAFRQLRAKLEKEGLFAPARKKALPRYPMRIALVTSRETAALQDMLKVLRRFAWIRLDLHNVAVQGDGSAQKIAQALDAVNRAGRANVILLGRGGGSLEDLWAFNEEPVARAIAASKIPVITGVGHEVDVTIADLVADYHAHTPTEAAQIVTRHWRNASEILESSELRLRRALRHRASDARHRLASVLRHETFRQPMHRINVLRQFLDDRGRALLLVLRRRLEEARRRLIDEAPQRLAQTVFKRLRMTEATLARRETELAARHPRHILNIARSRVDRFERELLRALKLRRERLVAKLDGAERQLQAVSPLAVLRRGYSMTMLKKDGTVLRSAGQIKGGEKLLTRLADGSIESVAEDPNQPKLFE